MEKKLPVDNDNLLPLQDFDVEIAKDDPSRFSEARYRAEVTKRVEDVFEIWKAYCDANSIRPYIHRVGFTAQMEELQRIDEMTGVKSAIEAYYAGADINYILSGMMR